jgi:hypothetical protein
VEDLLKKAVRCRLPAGIISSKSPNPGWICFCREAHCVHFICKNRNRMNFTGRVTILAFTKEHSAGQSGLDTSLQRSFTMAFIFATGLGVYDANMIFLYLVSDGLNIGAVLTLGLF